MAPEPKAPRTSRSIVPPFKLSTPLGTDIWRKPPTIDVFNAPTHPSPLPKHPLNTFHRARLTVSLPPTRYLRQFDQAGLLLHLTSPTTQKTKWLKTGIEFYNSRPWISTAGCDNWSDWSVVPLVLEKGQTEPKVTIEVERKGVSLWVYAISWGEGASEERMPLREVNWVFVDEQWEVGVGGFVARETEGDGEDELVAAFEGGVLVEVLDQ